MTHPYHAGSYRINNESRSNKKVYIHTRISAVFVCTTRLHICVGLRGHIKTLVRFGIARAYDNKLRKSLKHLNLRDGEKFIENCFEN